ncbi:phosphoadenylyl-sulfate reductase [Hyphomicrobium sp. CS1GBMeth3]|uniref:phosphoadenylyl-sulfate reductase n=1 Tax=Hyphomicrobium sp. CS1GBMeth3 TaxID=1892845 RepID=UPI0009FA6FD3|nr:phosphoadenylyl-sulfate reductase [Hyphomicrobium sp. CS1GBMeth3]
MIKANVRARADRAAGAATHSAPENSGEALARHLDAILPGLDDLEARLHAIADAIPGRVTFSSSLGLEDQAVLHAIAATGRSFDVFTLDTGRHFPETLETIEASELRYGLKIRVVFPDVKDVESLVARDGIMGFRQSVEARKACCNVRKVVPLNKALAGAAGWITGLRREQSAERAHVPFAVWDAEHQLIKLNPIADWSLEKLEAYIAANNVPVNPLHAQGFPSIGCQPCTRAIQPWEDIRAGRWWWENLDGKECGLHNRPKPKEAHA